MGYRPKPKWNQYKQRSKNLKNLGFSSYYEYLNSKLWQDVRSKALEKYNYTCRRCGKYAT